MSEVRPRRKRNQRDTAAPPMVLTERDTQILDMVYRCRVLRQDQLHALFFGVSKAASQRRLALLYHHGFLERHFLTVRASYLLSPALYMIDKRGIEHLRATLGYDAVHWQKGDNQVGQQFLEHTLAINDVRVAVTLACRTPDYALRMWQGEADLKANFDRVPLRDSSGRKQAVSLIPDSYFVLDTPRGIAHFFLELDRGTMTTKRFQGKIAAYLMYYQSGAYEQRYGTKSLRVLTVANSQKRLESLRQATQEAGGGARFWFAVLPDVQAVRDLNSPIWWATGKEGQFALVEPI